MVFFLQFDHLTNFTYLPMSAKRVSRFILFCLDLELFAKIKKALVSTHSLKPVLLLSQDLNKIKKIPNTHF